MSDWPPLDISRRRSLPKDSYWIGLGGAQEGVDSEKYVPLADAQTTAAATVQKLEADLERVEGEREKWREEVETLQGRLDLRAQELQVIAAHHEAFKERLTSEAALDAGRENSQEEYGFKPYRHVARCVVSGAISAAENCSGSSGEGEG